ncbi:MAG: hypothetical protein HY399_01855 [Elusimicrobia bacterium]|nr:hypothetical protein [Elusimicrobiota bacterium]
MTKRKLILLIIVAAAFYFGYLKLRQPSFKDIQQALPVQLDPRKGKQMAKTAEKVKEKANRAISAVEKELQKP